MDRQTAIDIIIGSAMAWAENKQEAMVRTITAATSNEECKAIADESGESVEDAILLRDFDRAVPLADKDESQLNLLVLIASQWTENDEEQFSERIRPDMTPEQCEAIASDSDRDLGDVLLVRDVWAAVELLTGVRLAGPPNESIFDYFARKLDDTPSDETFRDLPVDSACGDDCRRVIDLAAPLVAAVDPVSKDAIRHAVMRAIQVYWHG